VRVLVDFHHSDLLDSLYRLFEDRLGMETYVPRGLEWFERDYWQFGKWTFGDDRLGRQFLLGPERDNLIPDRVIRHMTLDEAQALDWDVIVATVPDNYDGYRRFAREKGAQFVIQVGNVNQAMGDCDLILDSTGAYPNGLAFTPEFDMDGAFRYEPPESTRQVASFVNLFPGLPCYGTYLATMEQLSDWQGKVFGHNGTDGFIEPASKIGDMMRLCDFGWQDKVTGDGFGYVIHKWASVGRPLIGHASHYRGQVAEDLWQEDTSIDLDHYSPAQAATRMNEIVNDWGLFQSMSLEIASRVRNRIDFAQDAERVAEALGLRVLA
jgi:hypothetical protein